MGWESVRDELKMAYHAAARAFRTLRRENFGRSACLPLNINTSTNVWRGFAEWWNPHSPGGQYRVGGNWSQMKRLAGIGRAYGPGSGSQALTVRLESGR